MIECPVCAKNLPDELSFCPYCGEPLLTPPPPYWLRAFQAALVGGGGTMLVVGLLFSLIYGWLIPAMSSDTVDVTPSITRSISPKLEEIGYLPHATNIETMQIVADNGYFVDRINGLQLFDVTKPSQPRPVSTYRSTFGSSQQLWAEDGYVALISGNRLELLQTDPMTTPTLLGAVEYAPRGKGLAEVEAMALAQPYLYVATGSDGLQVLNVLNLDKPYWVTNFEPPAEVRNVTVVENRLYLAMGEEGLWTLDTTQLPHSLVVVGTTEIPGDTRQVIPLAETSYLVLAAGQGVAVVDSTNLTKFLAYSDFYGQLGIVLHGTVVGDKLYVAGSNGIGLVDIADPTRLALLDFYDTSQPMSHVVVKDSWIYGTTWEGNVLLFRVAE